MLEPYDYQKYSINLSWIRCGVYTNELKIELSSNGKHDVQANFETILFEIQRTVL